MFVNRVAELQSVGETLHFRSGRVLCALRPPAGWQNRTAGPFLRGQAGDFLRLRPGVRSVLRTALSSAVNAVLFGPKQMNAVYATWEDLFQATWAGSADRASGRGAG